MVNLEQIKRKYRFNLLTKQDVGELIDAYEKLLIEYEQLKKSVNASFGGYDVSEKSQDAE